MNLSSSGYDILVRLEWTAEALVRHVSPARIRLEV